MKHTPQQASLFDMPERAVSPGSTDEHFTPDDVYAVVLDYVRPMIGDRPVVRPFWPGADYTAFDYPPGCVVVDNPPFSILAQIIDFFKENCIDYFLFAPLGGRYPQRAMEGKYGLLITGSHVQYASGLAVQTTFLTSLFCGVILAPDLGWKLKTCPTQSLYRRLRTVDSQTLNTMAEHGVSGHITADDIEIRKKLNDYPYLMPRAPKTWGDILENFTR